MKSIERMSNKRIGATLLLVTAMAAMTGCASTPDTNSADVDAQSMSDMLTERTILRALFDEPSLSGENILVSCVNGEVTLFGDVDSSNMSALAESTVRNLSGVNNLRNSISIN